MNRIKVLSLTMLTTLILSSCIEDNPVPELIIPEVYESANYESNVSAESTIISELSTMTAGANAAEANAANSSAEAIPYPNSLAAVTVPAYRELVEDWLVELVKSANDNDGFVIPGANGPDAGEEGGLLGTRLLDENGLELEQMVQKGSFGAGLYNHALTVVNGDLSDASAIDKLVEIHGTDPTFDPNSTTAAATYSRRRSNQTTETGTFYDIRNSLLRAKAAIEAGPGYEEERDQALADYLLAWEKSNFATVIYYCHATKLLMQSAGDDPLIQGNAMHAYAEGVGFAHGFKSVTDKLITDAQIDGVLELLLAPEGETPQSYRFLTDASLLINLDQIIEDLQEIYGFTDEEIISFYVNDPS